MVVITFVAIIAAICSQAKSQSPCLFQPLPGPDVYYDIYDCSYALDWSQNFPKMCKDVNTSYEVQFLYNCTNDSIGSQTFNTTKEQFSIPEYVLQQCNLEDGYAENTTCYARVGPQKPNGTLWSAWTNLSNLGIIAKAVQACIVKGANLCLAIPALNCGSGIPPEFAINQEHYIFQDLMGDNHPFQLVYDNQHNRHNICFKNVTTNVSYVEFCPSHLNVRCTIVSSSIDVQLKIIKRAIIQLGSISCGTCNLHNSMLESEMKSESLRAQERQCVVVDFKIGSDVSNDSICVSIVSPQHVLPPTMIHLHLTRTNGTTSNIRSLLINASQPDHCQEIKSNGTFEISLVGSDLGSRVFLPRPCLTYIINNETSTDETSTDETSTHPNKASRNTSTITLLISMIMMYSVFIESHLLGVIGN